MKEKHRRIWLCVMGKADLEGVPCKLRTEGWAYVKKEKGREVGARGGGLKQLIHWCRIQ